MNIDTQRAIDRYIGTIICRLFSLIHRVFKKDAATHNPQRILVILLSEMGALVLAGPMLQRLKEKFPRAALHVVLFEKNREVARLLGLVPPGNILVIDDRSMGTFVRGAVRLFFTMRKIKFDVVIDCELFSRISSIFSFLSGAVVRVGFHPHTQEGLYRGNFMNRPVLYNPYHHISRQFITLAEAVDSITSPRAKRSTTEDTLQLPPLAFAAAEIEAARRRLYQRAPSIKGRQLVLIYPGGGLLPIRAWPVDYYCQLTEKLLSRGYAVGVIGLAQDKTVAGSILERAAHECCVDLTGYTATVQELMQIFHFASLLITNDGGPGHFAAMTPIATIIFYGPETPALYGPLDEKAVVFYLGLSCSPCLTAYNHRKSPCDGDNVCLKMIEPDRVLEKALEILES